MTDTPDIPQLLGLFDNSKDVKNVLHPERFLCHVNKFIKRSEKLIGNYRASELASNSLQLERISNLLSNI